MTENEMLLAMVKIDLQITTTAYDDRLTQLITAAKSMIEREGITLNMTSMEDCNLVIMYAAYLWRKRDTTEEMPRMLRYAMNNRLFSQKMGVPQ